MILKRFDDLSSKKPTEKLQDPGRFSSNTICKNEDKDHLNDQNYFGFRERRSRKYFCLCNIR